MYRTEHITRLIGLFTATTPDVMGAALINVDGLMIASALDPELDQERVAETGAALLSLGERMVGDGSRGRLDLVMIRGEFGHVILSRCGPSALLAVHASTHARLGLILRDITRTANALGRELEE